MVKRDASGATELRRRAEKLLAVKTAKVGARVTDRETERLVHELEVHQIELEMQNVQLIQARDDAETALAKYADLYDFAPVGYFTLGRDGTILKANLTGASLLGIERSRLIGRNFSRSIGKESRSQFTPFLDQVFASRDIERCEVAFQAKNEQPLLARIEAVAGKSGEECNIAVIDFSDRKRAEDERMIIQQGRQEALGDMLNSVSHHWRQPLNAVGLIIQELEFASENDSLSKDHLKASVENAMQIIIPLSQTLDSFRNFFIPDQRKSRFRVNKVISDTVSLVEAGFKEKQILIVVNTLDDPFIDGYLHEYSQVFLNILFNARDALSERENGSARITINTFTEEGKAVVTIADNAGGINKETMGRIFEPYFTTKDPGKGTGVGLFMAKTVIEKHMGGRLTVRNVKGGAEFRIEV